MASSNVPHSVSVTSSCTSIMYLPFLYSLRQLVYILADLKHPGSDQQPACGERQKDEEIESKRADQLGILGKRPESLFHEKPCFMREPVSLWLD